MAILGAHGGRQRQERLSDKLSLVFCFWGGVFGDSFLLLLACVCHSRAPNLSGLENGRHPLRVAAPGAFSHLRQSSKRFQVCKITRCSIKNWPFNAMDYTTVSDLSWNSPSDVDHERDARNVKEVGSVAAVLTCHRQCAYHQHLRERRDVHTDGHVLRKLLITQKEASQRFRIGSKLKLF